MVISSREIHTPPDDGAEESVGDESDFCRVAALFNKRKQSTVFRCALLHYKPRLLRALACLVKKLLALFVSQLDLRTMQKIYTVKDRIIQLEELALALELFIVFLNENKNIEAPMETYQYCLLETQKLLCINFTQEQLSALSRSVPAIFWLHKEWSPTLTLNHQGEYVEPEWFGAADKQHSRVMQAAGTLRIIGTY